MKNKFNLTDDWDEISILKTSEEIPVNFKNTANEYLNFLKERRKLKHWTRYQICFNLKYFFEFIDELDVSTITQIQRNHILQYLTYLKKKNSQKTVYTRSRELESLLNGHMTIRKYSLTL